MKTATTFSEKRILRDIILEHFLSANDMASILEHPEIKGRFNDNHVRRVVYSLESSAMLFASGKTKAARYQTTEDGKKLINHE